MFGDMADNLANPKSRPESSIAQVVAAARPNLGLVCQCLFDCSLRVCHVPGPRLVIVQIYSFSQFSGESVREIYEIVAPNATLKRQPILFWEMPPENQLAKWPAHD